MNVQIDVRRLFLREFVKRIAQIEIKKLHLTPRIQPTIPIAPVIVPLAATPETQIRARKEISPVQLLEKPEKEQELTEIKREISEREEEKELTKAKEEIKETETKEKPSEKFASSQKIVSEQMQPVQSQQVQPAKPAPAPRQALIAQIPQAPQSPSMVSWERIRQMLIDPSVQSVECPGPDKPFQVNRFGAIQTTSLILKKEEIDSLLKELSDKTRIPLVTGLFRVRYQGLLVTAVISEFVGTRFVVQRAPLAY